MGNDSALLLGMALTGCALVRIDPEIEAQFEAAKTEATVQANAIRPHIEADLNALSAYPWMADRTCVRDASEVLHPLFGFEDNTYIDQGLLPPPSHRGPAAKALRKAAEKWRSAPEGAHWMTQGADPEVQAQTLPWVTALRDFDCWDITAHSPWDQVDPVALDFFPNPGGQTLFAASMLLLMQLHVPLDHPTQSDSERIQQTLADVRRLATLCIQSQEFITARIGANILQREREAVEHLTAQGRAPVEWHVVPKADNDRLYRLLTASPAFANFFTPLKHRELATSTAFSVGRCAGIREGTRVSMAYQGLIGDERLEWLNGVLDQSASLGCHHNDIRYLRARPEKRLANHEPFTNPLLTPAMRQAEAMTLAATAIPMYGAWSDYEY